MKTWLLAFLRGLNAGSRAAIESLTGESAADQIVVNVPPAAQQLPFTITDAQVGSSKVFWNTAV